MNGDNINETLCGAPHFDDGSNTDAGKAYCHSIFIIPEFSEIVMPVFVMILIFAIWRRKRTKKKIKNEPRNSQDNGLNKSHSNRSSKK